MPDSMSEVRGHSVHYSKFPMLGCSKRQPVSFAGGINSPIPLHLSHRIWLSRLEVHRQTHMGSYSQSTCLLRSETSCFFFLQENK